MQAEKSDHVVLIDAVARNADAADQLRAAIDRHAARKNLCTVGQLRNGAGDGKTVVEAIDARAVCRHIGRECQRKANMLDESVVDEIELQPGRERTPLAGRLAEGASRVAGDAVGEIGS